MPPYGNLGLRRMPEDPLKLLGAELSARAQAFKSDLPNMAAAAATQLGRQAASKVVAATELGKQAASKAAVLTTELEKTLNEPTSLEEVTRKAEKQIKAVSRRYSPEVLMAAAVAAVLVLVVLLRACR